MSELTKEWLQQTIAELEEERDATPGAVSEDAAMALAAMKIALASLEAEAVAFRSKLKPPSAIGSDNWGYTDHRLPDAFELESCVIERLYTDPPAPVSVPADVMSALQKVARIRLDLNDFDGDRRGIAECLGEAEEALIEVVNRRAAMLQGVENAETPTTMQTAPALDYSPKIAESPSGNSPVIPDCWCRTCRPVVLNDMRFVVCPDCGNKRCPRANDHKNSCTGSNEPGQEGSAYPASPQEVKGE
ncbi:TPA: hypothetical protein N5O23_000723 [Enterobacter hormaechei subsp. steigerwaltii]|nr:hypothetical protein [Enterobacter hormaechei subsp. steigerwaltii]